MFLEILKDDTYQTLIDEINNCGYSIHELSDISSVSKKDIKKISFRNIISNYNVINWHSSLFITNN